MIGIKNKRKRLYKLQSKEQIKKICSFKDQSMAMFLFEMYYFAIL